MRPFLTDGRTDRQRNFIGPSVGHGFNKNTEVNLEKIQPSLYRQKIVPRYQQDTTKQRGNPRQKTNSELRIQNERLILLSIVKNIDSKLLDHSDLAIHRWMLTLF